MASPLLLAQFEFTEDVSMLIWKAREMGFRSKMGEVLRSKEMQELMVRTGRSKTLNSRHAMGLAIDLLLFRGDEYLADTEDYRDLGEWWEQLRPGENVWGGSWEFKDGNHFERQPPVTF